MRLSTYLPDYNWVVKMNGRKASSDIYAGFISAALVLPQGVAFATIAGLPPVYGLYTAMITGLIASVFGSSMVMISGPATAISAVLFATLSNFAVPETAHYIQLAFMLTIMVGVFQIAAGLGGLGSLVTFVSHSVMTAFTASAAVLIAVSQVAGTIGIDVERGGNIVERMMQLGAHVTETNPMALMISGATFVLAVLSQKLFPKLPGFLIALVGGSLLAWVIDAGNQGVSMVGALPPLALEFTPPKGVLSDIGTLAPGAAAIALVGLLEAISIGRAFAVRRKENFDPNQEMIGQGLSNFVGGFFQCFVGSGSFTRSGLNATMGAGTPLSGITASLFLGLILLFVAPLVAYIPTPAMSGLIMLVAWRLIDVKEITHILTSKSPETVILLLTLAAGLLVQLDFAIYVGVIASLCVFIYDSAHPVLPITVPVVSASGERKFRDAELHNLVQCPQLVTFRLDGPLFFGSVEHVERRIKEIRQKHPKQIHMVFYLKGVGRLDLAGADLLIETIREIKSKGGSFRIVALFPPLISSLHKFHVIEELGEDHLFQSKGEAISDATKDLDRSICKACLRDVFLECDSIRDEEID
jgi:SulP family sulfate permease